MRPGYCVNWQEYNRSKRILFQFILCIEDKIGDENVRQIIEFIRDHVEPQEAYFCFYMHMDPRNFGSYLNSGHEGTNHGMKSCAGAVMPQHALNKSIKVLTQQGNISSKLNEERVCFKVNGHKSWSLLKCGEKLLKKVKACKDSSGIDGGNMMF